MTAKNVREDTGYVESLPDMVGTALAAGDDDLAARLARDVDPIWPLHQHALTTAQALLAEHRGERAEAADLFAQAAEGWERFQMPWERAQALLGWGRCLLALGRPAEATPAIRQARELFATLGARPGVRETDALLERGLAASS